MTDSDVARSIRKAIYSFKRSNPGNLKRIDVVVYETRMLPAFNKALVGKAAVANTTSTTTKLQSSQLVRTKPVFSQSTSVMVTVTTGDILNSSCEVLVNTTGTNYDFSEYDHMFLNTKLMSL